MQLEKILDTYQSVVGKDQYTNISLDYSVVKEDKKVQKNNQYIETAISNHHQIYFNYDNNDNLSSYKM